MKRRIHTFAVCAYKESEYLEECIKSLINQTVKSDLIVVTHTPNDHIKGICERYSLPLYVNEGESGITQDWNYAVSVCKTKYVTIAHQDDLYEPEYTRNVVGKLRNEKHPLIGFSDYYEIRNGKRIDKSTMIRIKRILLLPLLFPFVIRVRFLRRYVLSLGDPIICPSITYAVNNLDMPIFNNHFLCDEDWEMLEKVFKMKGDIVYFPRKMCGHRLHEESTTSKALSNGIRKKENLEMFKKFWPTPIAKVLNGLYNKSEKYNDVNNI